MDFAVSHCENVIVRDLSITCKLGCVNWRSQSKYPLESNEDKRLEREIVPPGASIIVYDRRGGMAQHRLSSVDHLSFSPLMNFLKSGALSLAIVAMYWIAIVTGFLNRAALMRLRKRCNICKRSSKCSINR